MARTRKIKFVFIIYWSMLLYILAALIWWFIALNNQNDQMTRLKMEQLQKDQTGYELQYRSIVQEDKRKKAQYIGEGVIFLFLIVGAAIFIYRAVVREFRRNREQQNFMMAITHELKTPISVAMLNLETIQKHKLDESKQLRLIQKTLEETNRLNALCNNLLISSQIEGKAHPYTPEELDLSRLLRDIVHDYTIRYPERKFYAEISDNLEVVGDPFMLKIVFSNLIDNACKYSNATTGVSVVASTSEYGPFVKIADEGMGIPDIEKNKVFQKFYRVGNQATRQAKGTGLGLYLVKRLLNDHHANIEIKDNTPHGTIFVIQFKKTD